METKINFIAFKDGSVSVYWENEYLGNFDDRTPDQNEHAARAFALGYETFRLGRILGKSRVASLPIVSFQATAAA